VGSSWVKVRWVSAARLVRDAGECAECAGGVSWVRALSALGECAECAGG
jgi:hypothetical protein